MHYKNLIITAPALDTSTQCDAEIFGAVAWIAMHAKNKKQRPLQELSDWLVPALRNQQFILGSEAVDGHMRPVAYMSWANFTPQAESKYVNNPDDGLRLHEWTGGDRMWVIDWMTPFGHSPVFCRAVSSALAGYCFKSLYHRSGNRGLRVMLFRGKGVSLSHAKQWWKSRPILANKLPPL